MTTLNRDQIAASREFFIREFGMAPVNIVALCDMADAYLDLCEAATAIEVVTDKLRDDGHLDLVASHQIREAILALLSPAPVGETVETDDGWGDVGLLLAQVDFLLEEGDVNLDDEDVAVIEAVRQDYTAMLASRSPANE